jgi:hypothetical protein
MMPSNFQYLAFQLTYPGLKISTLQELFEFARCADPERTILWNIESKINPVDPSSTRGVDDFVGLQHQAFLNSGYKLSQITVGLDFFFPFITDSDRDPQYQSFDWRTLVSMKVWPKLYLVLNTNSNSSGC